MAAQSTKSTLKKTVGLVALTAAVGLVTYGTLHLVRVDAFANFAPTGTKADRLAFELTNVRITHYNGAKLVTMALVDHVSVQKNRQNMFLEGIHDGVYRGEQGEIKFSGKTAEWNAVRKRLDVTTGAHIKSVDFDLQVPHCELDSIKSRLTVPGEIKGKIADGDITAVGFAYNTKTHDWQTGKASWTGPLALAQDGDTKSPPETWNVKGEGKGHAGIETYTDAYAENTNGETIVTAQTITRDVKKKIITAKGKVFYYSAKANMTCDLVTIYTDEKRAVFTGNVNMIIKPKSAEKKAKVEEIPPFRPMVPDAVAERRPAAPPPGEDEDPVRSRSTLRKFPMAVLADKIEYWYKKGNRHAIATGSPQAYQTLPQDSWRRVWATEADYDGEGETMLLKSSADKIDTRVRTSIGDNMVAEWIKLSTKDEDDADEWTASKMSGLIVDGNQNENNGPSKPPPGFDRAARIPKLPSVQPGKRSGSGGLQGPIGGQLLTRVPVKAVAVKHPVKLPKLFWPF